MLNPFSRQKLKHIPWGRGRRADDVTPDPSYTTGREGESSAKMTNEMEK